MTIATETSRWDFNGNDVADTFAFTGRIFTGADLIVEKVLLSTEAVTTLTLDTDYTVETNAPAPGGNVILTDPLPSTYRLVVRRVLDLVQETDIRNQGAFFAETHEDALDHKIMIDQQQQEELGRAVKFAPTSETSDVVFPEPSDGKFIKWSGETLTNVEGTPASTELNLFNAADYDSIQDAVDAAVAAGGGVVYISTGTWEISAPVVVESSNVRIVGAGRGITVVEGTGTLTPFNAFRFTGGGSGAELGPLTGNLALGSNDLALTAVTGLAVGDYLRIMSVVELPPGQDSICGLIAEVTAISSLNVALEAPAPIAFLASEDHNVLEWDPIKKVGLSNLTIDMNGASGAVTRGVLIEDVAESDFENIEIFNCSESGFQTWRGYRNTYSNIRLRLCGSGQESDFQPREEHFGHFNNINSINAAGFGPQWIACSYCTIDGVTSFGPNGRGIKTAGALACMFGNLTTGNATSTGLAISLRTQRCVFNGVTSMGNGAGVSGNDIGVWFSGQLNIGNRVMGLIAIGNVDYDVQINDTDTNNLVMAAWITGALKFNNPGGPTNAMIYHNSGSFHGLVTADNDASNELSSGFMKMSASPAANDFLGRTLFRGMSDAGNERSYAEVSGFIGSPVNGAETGGLDLNIIQAGAVVIGAEVLTPANTLETALLVRRNIAGVFSLARLKFGADGTGPGGVGRAVYLDP